MQDGDIYRWSWKSNEAHHFGDPYHCKTREAIVIDGKLMDTFWMHHGSKFINGGWGPTADRGSIDPDKVCLSLISNLSDLDEIRHGHERYYRPKDVVDLRHSNNSNAPVYIKRGAAKNAEVMRRLIHSKRMAAEREIRVAKFTIERMDAIEALIDSGDIDAVNI